MLDAPSPLPFEQSKTNPWLAGLFAPVHEELDAHDLKIEGQLPRALSGMYLRNGPNPQFEPPGRYHVFDGDGMIHAVYLEDGKARYRNRYVVSRGLQYEREQGKGVFYGMAEFKLPPPDVLQRFGFSKNVANTHVIGHGGQVLALFEGSAPTALDRDLNTLRVEKFGGKLGKTFTAHPRPCAVTGNLYAFGANTDKPHLDYYIVNSKGELIHTEQAPVRAPIMVHDFVITENYAIFFDAPAVYNLMGAFTGKGEPVEWKPEMGTRVGVMPREGGADQIRWFDVDNGYVFHFYNAFEQDGSIIIEGGNYPVMTLSGDSGAYATPTRWTIDLAGGTTKTEQLIDMAVEMTNIDDRRQGLEYRYGYSVHFDGGNEVANWDRAARFDRKTGAFETYRYGEGQVTGEVVYVPNPESDVEEDGYLLSYVYNPQRGATDLVGLSAGDLAAGPLFRVQLPQRVPLGFHGSFIPAE